MQLRKFYQMINEKEYFMPSYSKENYGFWRQQNPVPFTYDDSYEQKQSTNIEMVYLRLGWLSAHICFDALKEMTVVDVGAGNGSFVNHSKGKFKNIYSYDIVGSDTISEETLKTTEWDLMVFSDVLEHYEDIEDLFKYKWKYVMVSFPETPEVTVWQELESWKHFKPNEHLWHLNMKGMIQWFIDHSCEVIGSGHPEDILRKRWSACPNISTILAKRT